MIQLPDINRGTSADLPRVVALLSASGLPTADLSGITHLDLWVMELAGSLTGVIALERYGEEGLVRSLAVVPPYRNRGYGAQLVDRLEADAVREGVRHLGY